jgi:hypothetical protein
MHVLTYPIEHNRPAHLYRPGQSGNPLGRPKGSRNRLGEDFLRALADDFAEHGSEAIEDVRINSPKDYLKVIASLLPKGVELDVLVEASPQLKIELSKFVADFRLVRDAMHRIGVADDVVDAITFDDDS